MEYLSDEDEDRPTRMSSPDTSSSEQGRGAALVKRPWTPEEDMALIAAVHKYGAARWSMIATQLSTGRVGKQCRERWNNHLCPEVKKTEWSEEEDRSILQGVAVLGTRWCEIVKAPPLVGRTDNAIKNRFYSLQRRMKARQCGGVRHGRRPANATESEEEDREPPSRADRIVAIATELAFATDECERDRLIEQLTTALHDGAPEEDDEAFCNDDASDLGPLESPSSLAQLSHALRSHRGCGFDTDMHASQPCDYGDDETADPSALLDQIDDPPTPLPMGGASSSSASAALDAALSGGADSNGGFGLEAIDGESVQASVSMVADLLHLPHSPRQASAGQHPPSPAAADDKPAADVTMEEKAEVLAGGGASAGMASQAVADCAMDDAASATTISPDAVVGGASLEEDAWKLPSSAEKRPREEEEAAEPPSATPAEEGAVVAAAQRPFVRAAVLAVSSPRPAGDKPLTERNVSEGAAGEQPVTAACASSVQRARPVRAEDAPAAVGGGKGGVGGAAEASSGCGGATSPNEVINVSAALLGGRQAYKACLAPLRLPARDETCDVDSPKRMRTVNGSAPGPAGSTLASVRGGSGLRIVAAPLSEAENVFPIGHVGPVVASCAPAAAVAVVPAALIGGGHATGTEEPGVCAAAACVAATPLSCASPMIDLSIFGDLFAEDGTCCNPNGCAASNGMCSSSSQVAAAVAAASLMPCQQAAAGGEVTAAAIISPETAPTSLASTIDASPASRKSVRRPKNAVRFATVA